MQNKKYKNRLCQGTKETIPKIPQHKIVFEQYKLSRKRIFEHKTFREQKKIFLHLIFIIEIFEFIFASKYSISDYVINVSLISFLQWNIVIHLYYKNISSIIY